MAEAFWEDLLERIRPECKRCPTDVMVQAIRDTARDFCQITRAWQLEKNDAEILAGTADYATFVPGAWAQPIAIEFLQINGERAVFKTTDWLDTYIPNWRFRAADDFRYFTHLAGPATITFPCVPTVNGTVDAMRYRTSYKPADDGDRIEQKMVDEWIEAFSDGAKAKLLSMEGEPWYKPKRAGQLEAAYRTARSRARVRVSKSWGNSTDAWAYRGGFA